MFIAFSILAVIATLATYISLVYRKMWWIRVFDFPRTQILVLQILSMAGILLFINRWDWMSVTTGIMVFSSFIIQIVYVYPYFIFARKDLPKSNKNPNNTVSLMMSNVLTTNRKSKKLLELIKKYDPDIFLAVETDHWWNNALRSLDKRYEYTVKKPLNNTYGMLLFSKLPLKNAEIKYIIKKEIPSIHADVVLDDFIFKLRCLHPEPPAPDEADTSRPRDRELIRMARLIKEQPVPHIVLGDLNDVAWSDTSYKFERISELHDPRKGRGFFNTFHARFPFFRWALDHIFVSRDFKVIELKRLPYVGSDHFPMYFKFGIDSVT